MVFVEKNLDVNHTLSRITQLLRQSSALESMSQASRSQGKTEVAQQVAMLLETTFAK